VLTVGLGNNLKATCIATPKWAFTTSCLSYTHFTAIICFFLITSSISFSVLQSLQAKPPVLSHVIMHISAAYIYGEGVCVHDETTRAYRTPNKSNAGFFSS
jgi:hypothetical protein